MGRAGNPKSEIKQRCWFIFTFLCVIMTVQEAPSETFRRPRWDPEPSGTVRTNVGVQPLRFGLDAGLWFSSWSVRAETASAVHKTSNGPLFWIAPRIDMDLSSRWMGTVRFEIAQGSDLDAKALAFHFSHPILDAGDALVRFHAGPAIGILDAHRFPGDFGDAVGFDLGVTGEMPFARGWNLRTDLSARYMKFEYSRSPDVSSASDHATGPVGILASIGLTYHF